MAKRKKKITKPRDISQKAFLVVQQATGQIPAVSKPTPKNPAAIALGKLGGSKGGKRRASRLTKKRLSHIARQAAQARWGK